MREGRTYESMCSVRECIEVVQPEGDLKRAGAEGTGAAALIQRCGVFCASFKFFKISTYELTETSRNELSVYVSFLSFLIVH